MFEENKTKYRLHNSQYYDFVLADGDYVRKSYDPVIHIKTCSGLTSLTRWEGATVNETILEHIPLTGLDNFYISGSSVYNNGIIDTGYTVTIPSGYNFTFHAISGHSTGSSISYDIVNSGDTFCTKGLQGGFYQGFYKLHNYPVQLLPDRMVKGWTMNTIVKYPNTKTISGQTLNDIYPNNSGFIFYMGTRAENKYRNISENEITKISNAYNIARTKLENNAIITDENEIYVDFFAGMEATTVTASTGNRARFVPHHLYTTGDMFLLSGETYTGYYNISGTTYYTGKVYNVNTSERLELMSSTKVLDNSFGVRINSDGKIGYRVVRMATYDGCISGYSESGVTISGGVAHYVTEKYSEYPVFKDGNTGRTMISVVFERNVNLNTECIRKYSDFKKGTLTIYVNGRPVLIDKNFIEIIPTELDTLTELQEGVPFNLSWGGGTQGLYESVTFGADDPDDRTLILEQNFAGSWLGGLNEYEFYIEPLHFTEIIKKFKEKKDIYNLRGSFGGRTVEIIRG